MRKPFVMITPIIRETFCALSGEHSILMKLPSKNFSDRSRWIRNLLAVLMRLHQHQRLVIADNEGRFFQVGELANYQSSLQILGREDTTTDVITY